MKLMLYTLDNYSTIEMDINGINVLEIENRNYFLKLLQSLKGYIFNPLEVGVLDNENFLDLEKTCSVIIDYIGLDNASKNILTKLYNKIIEESNSQLDLITKLSELSNSLIEHIDNLTLEMDLNLEFVSKINIKDYLHFVGLVPVNSEKPLEKLLDYISLIGELNLYRVVVLVNPKSFFSDAEMIEIYKYSLYKRINLLIVENFHRETKLNYEIKYYIDEDLFDIKL